MSAFFTLHRDLPREGPGEAADVAWVLAQVPPPARVLDMACGPGADKVELAAALPEAQIVAIDRQAHFVAAAAARCAGFGSRVQVRQGDLAEPGGPYDLIWCAGAAYIVGLERALTLWRSALAPGGHVAVSEPVLIGALTDELVEFWYMDPPPLDEAGVRCRIAGAGYRVVATRMVQGQAWDDYYRPMEARIAALRPGADAGLGKVLDEASREIHLWRRNRGQIAYLLALVAPA